ncbi:MAG: 50S ribosomal protein L5 [Chloroflexota bacterium]|nr:50S ribosomal protein L5 [Chloroflexota bacterium]
MQRLKKQYRDEVRPKMVEEFGYDNVMEAPRLQKIVVNVGVGEGADNPKALDHAVQDIMTITGQRPVVTRAKRSISVFKIREGDPIGVKVTLRGERMWAFLDRLCNVALARQRDFRGVKDKLDGRGNYTVGLTEQLVFPEIDYDSVDQVRGMEITLVTTAETDEEGRRLLDLLGMPFRRLGQ